MLHFQDQVHAGQHVHAHAAFAGLDQDGIQFGQFVGGKVRRWIVQQVPIGVMERSVNLLAVGFEDRDLAVGQAAFKGLPLAAAEQLKGRRNAIQQIVQGGIAAEGLGEQEPLAQVLVLTQELAYPCDDFARFARRRDAITAFVADPQGVLEQFRRGIGLELDLNAVTAGNLRERGEVQRALGLERRSGRNGELRGTHGHAVGFLSLVGRGRPARLASGIGTLLCGYSRRITPAPSRRAQAATPVTFVAA
jgi:hypothetical protein